MEVASRNDMEKDVNCLINSPGAVKDQMQMWSEKGCILEQITDLQSSLIDKDYILKQNDVITDLRARFESIGVY